MQHLPCRCGRGSTAVVLTPLLQAQDNIIELIKSRQGSPAVSFKSIAAFNFDSAGPGQHHRAEQEPAAGVGGAEGSTCQDCGAGCVILALLLTFHLRLNGLVCAPGRLEERKAARAKIAELGALCSL